MFHATGLPGWARGGVLYGVPDGAAPTPEQELAALKLRADSLDTALGNIRRRIGELDAKPAEK